MDHEYLGMYLQSIMEMYKKGDFNVMSNPEKEAIRLLLNEYEEMKKRAE